MTQSDLLADAAEALLSNRNNLSPNSSSSQSIVVTKRGSSVQPALQSVPTFVDDDAIPFDSDHQSNLPQVRRLNADHDFTGLHVIPWLQIQSSPADVPPPESAT
jgi:hypothetical protein